MIKTIKNISHISLMIITLFSGSFMAISANAQEKEHISIEVSKGTLVRFDKDVDNVFIADPTIADIQIKSPTLAYVFGKRQGQTSLYAISEDDEVVFEGEVTVNHNLGNFEAALNTVMPDSRIKVEVYEGLLILTGHVKNPEQAEEARRMATEFIGAESTIMNKLQIATPVQVNLRVRIAEVGRETMKQLGFNWENLLSTSGGTMVGIAQGRDAFSGIGVGAAPTDGAVFTTDGGNFFGRLPIGNLDVNFLVDAMEEEGVISVLAEPNLTTLSGESASFLAGGEYPVPVFQQQGISVQYKEFGVALNFTPVVLDSGRINIHLNPEVSQLTSSGAITVQGLNIPALSTRKVETTVELGSGQSFAVAGLMQNSGVHDLTKFPWLADIPIIGALFKSSEFTRQESELVVIVTPYIVKPNNDDNMHLPTDNFRYPNDRERYLEGKSFVGTATNNPEPIQGANGQRIKGAAGFILE
ncbi:type II and III secretion system protein family protein [Pseudemcibacter aquimaris]|uniref:type II and III secretion system protein family protein n=1 Tax=Pseudemcibacter aquimaris TaxID=2857064 RepID=UPI002012B366|nr:type II and III secretion system protein family protein [Pseudemcibacter aquimaris]MCC3861442.1 type II and III secretion system protein family protein [Pseudemcibacter aquimaris]WDU58211.1 type II and III secretion system protein family protein [Pseudemcibacter aquimaris]